MLTEAEGGAQDDQDDQDDQDGQDGQDYQDGQDGKARWQKSVLMGALGGRRGCGS